MRNLHKLFYKDYFNNVTFRIENDKITAQNPNNTALLNAVHKTMPKLEQYVNQSFQLIVSYPGLITGVGINHEAGIEGEFKLGVHFDYTYGMPVVYGSSVKGLLRSAFPADSTNLADNTKSKNAAKEQYIKDELKNLQIENADNIDIVALRNNIFNNNDVFFDAVIIEKNNSGRFLESDSLAPHDENPLKNPIPISFLKIASGVEMEFRFCLHACTINGIEITANNKRDLFEKILKDFGIGAKTNVGYGQFSCDENNPAVSTP
jgi:CRISPR-associated protein Cmr6